MKLPVVAIVGRPNVGKSSLLNCLARERVAIVEETPGVTRDRVSTIIFHVDVAMELVDTGGIGIVDREDLVDHIDRQIEMAVHGADLILLVVDAHDGLVPLDREVASRLRESANRGDRKRPIFLVVNKVDSAHHEPAVMEFFALGLGDPIAVSSTEGYGRTDLLDRMVKRLPPTGEAAAEPVMKLAVVGRQNVGKSTFVNAMATEERVIVSEIPGTTRDAVDVRFEKDGRTFVVIDTAGMKRRARVKDSVDFYSQVRSDVAIRRADVVLFMIDAVTEISKVEKKISETVASRAKPCVLLVNKWDLTEGKIETERYAKYARSRLPGVSYAPMVFITARESRNVQAAVDIAQHLFKKAKMRIGTGELNRVVEKIRAHHGPSRVRGRLPKIYYATQVGSRPPTFVFFVNDPKLFPGDYRRYVENRLRDDLAFEEIPLRVFFRQRESIYRVRSKN